MNKYWLLLVAQFYVLPVLSVEDIADSRRDYPIPVAVEHGLNKESYYFRMSGRQNEDFGPNITQIIHDPTTQTMTYRPPRRIHEPAICVQVQGGRSTVLTRVVSGHFEPVPVEENEFYWKMKRVALSLQGGKPVLRFSK